MMIIMAVTIPRLRPEIEKQRIREAARSLHLYLTAARNRAVLENRPCGILIDRLATLSNAAATITQIRGPVPYGGESPTSVAQVYWYDSSGNGQPPNLPLYAYMSNLASPSDPGFTTGFVGVGDRIQFNYQGPWYTIATVVDQQTFTLQPDLTQGQQLPWVKLPTTHPPPNQPPQPPPVSYTVKRQPVNTATVTSTISTTGAPCNCRCRPSSTWPARASISPLAVP